MQVIFFFQFPGDFQVPAASYRSFSGACRGMQGFPLLPSPPWGYFRHLPTLVLMQHWKSRACSNHPLNSAPGRAKTRSLAKREKGKSKVSKRSKAPGESRNSGYSGWAATPNKFKQYAQVKCSIMYPRMWGYKQKYSFLKAPPKFPLPKKPLPLNEKKRHPPK